MEQTPKQYIKEMIDKGWMKGTVRIHISNLLKASYLQSDKEFYSQALRELDSF
jgi:hypothetical protein